jgi:predicted NBD/HSP70 family sugar kinase
LDAGIGAGLVLEGHLYRGSHGAAGEVGYVIPNVSYLGRVYDGFGCLENLAGGSAMVQRMEEKKIEGRGPTAQGSPDPLSLAQVFRAARAGDQAATAVVAEAVDYLSLAIANLACIIDPDRIVLSGWMADFADLFIEPIRRRIQGILPAETEIIQSDLGIEAAVYGAVLSVMRYTGDAVFVQPSRV